MVTEEQIELAEEIAYNISAERLYENYKNTENDIIKARVAEVIADRGECPECEIDLFFDSLNESYYCPVCNFDFDNA